jgi:predicted transcriptional regulator
LPRILELRVGPPADALDRFEAAWNRVAEGRKVAPLRILSLEDLPSVLKALSPARWELVRNLREKGETSIYDLAKRLGRDYKNVHTDVTQLLALGLLQKIDAKVGVAWDVVRAEIRL